MPCDTTSYPHGTIPGDRRYLRFLDADNECENTCVVIVSDPPDLTYADAATALANCLGWINGGCPPPDGCGNEFGTSPASINTFDYVSAGMVCEPCSTVDVISPEVNVYSGSYWRVGLSYCCVDSLVETADLANGQECITDLT